MVSENTFRSRPLITFNSNKSGNLFFLYKWAINTLRQKNCNVLHTSQDVFIDYFAGFWFEGLFWFTVIKKRVYWTLLSLGQLKILPLYNTLNMFYTRHVIWSCLCDRWLLAVRILFIIKISPYKTVVISFWQLRHTQTLLLLQEALKE